MYAPTSMQSMVLWFAFKLGTITTITLSLLLAALVVVFYFRWRRTYVHLKNVGGPSDDWPLLRTITSHMAMQNMQREFGVDYNVLFFQYLCAGTARMRHQPFYKAYMGDVPYVIIEKPEAAEAVLNSNVLIEKSIEYKWLRPWLGTGLLTSSGSKWKIRRKMLTPSFHFRILDDFLPIINEHAVVFTNVLRGKLDEKKGFDIAQLVARCTLDVICETAMGTCVYAQKYSDSEYVKAVIRLGELFFSRVSQPWMWLDAVYNLTSESAEFSRCLSIIHTFTRKVIRERKQMYLKLQAENAGDFNDDAFQAMKARRAFLDLLLSQHFKDPSFTEEDIREEVDTFMFEGHDTTAVGISWALYMIGLHQDVQDKIVEELDEIFGSDTERDATMEDVRRMKYLECVLKESLRLFPSVPLIGRELQEDWQYAGTNFPKGTICTIFIYSLHRDPKTFPKPEEFIPERFLPENCVGRHPFSYVPFSAGPRNCIGQKFALMEMKTLVSRVLRNYRLQSMYHRDKVQMVSELVLRSRNGLHIKISERQH
ncbi:cytochrome P450 4V2-like [Ornithodoros turicata]|uniref:cytochrome P450 4V2-like n=1 Tax=Ornithodoros turicata TaxID=34597 RepID=UPI003138A2E9